MRQVTLAGTLFLDDGVSARQRGGEPKVATFQKDGLCCCGDGLNMAKKCMYMNDQLVKSLGIVTIYRRRRAGERGRECESIGQGTRGT